MNPKQIEEFYHLSPAQKVLLAESELATTADATLLQFRCIINGALDVAALKRAWQKVTDRQTALRMAFVSGDLKEPVQVVNRSVSADFEEHDWREIPKLEQKLRLQQFFAADLQVGFALKTAPLWRLMLIRTADTTYHFCWTYHQLLLDAHSLTILLSEVFSYYDAICQAQNLFIPHPPSYRKFVDWSKKQDAHPAEDFWREQTQNAQPTFVAKFCAAEGQVNFSDEQFAVLQQFAAKHELEAETILLGAWALFLQRQTRQAAITLGLRVSGRPQNLPMAERIIGRFSHTVPFIVKFPLALTARDWLLQLQTQCNELRKHDFFAYDAIASRCDLPAIKELCDAEIMFALNSIVPTNEMLETPIEFQAVQLHRPNRFPVTLKLRRTNTPSTLNHAHEEEFLQLLDQLQRQSGQNLVKFCAPQIEAKADTVVPTVSSPPWREAATDVSEEQGWVTWLKETPSVNDLWAERVQALPNEFAINFGQQLLTNQELDARANQIARYLRKLGVTPQTPVVLWLDNYAELTLGSLAILKAGGAYLPLNLHHTGAQLQQTILASTAKIILTSEKFESEITTLLTAHKNDPATTTAHIVLCLDRHWSDIATQRSEPYTCDVSDRHPACLLYENNGREVNVITQARLALALKQTPHWFTFGTHNPWNFPPLSLQAIPPEQDPLDDAFLFTTAPSASPLDEIELISGLAPEVSTLAPIQRWFLTHHLAEPQHWNIARLVEIPDKLEPHLLQKALRFLEENHSALRLRFTQTMNDWQAQVAEPSTALPFEYVDLSAKWAKSQRNHIEELAAQLQTSLDLANGPLWRVVYFDLGAAPTDRLLVIFHHLIGDEISLQIFLRDLQTIYGQLQTGAPLALPLASASYQEWVRALNTQREKLDVVSELQFWQSQTGAGALPIDNPNGENTYGATDRAFISLNTKETETLFSALAENPALDLNEIVLTALATAVTQWAGENAALIEIEKSARTDVIENSDLRNSLGWFTYQFPLLIEVGKANAMDAVEIVRTKLQETSAHAVNYGLLRYDSDELIRQKLADLPQPQIHYQFIVNKQKDDAWKEATEALGEEHFPHNARRVKIAITGLVNFGMLEFQWTYARAQFEQKNIGTLVNKFIEDLRALIQQYTKAEKAAS